MNKKMIITVFVLVLIVVIVGIFFMTRKTVDENVEEISQTKAKTIRVNEVTRSVFYAPQYVAINNEYFKENGIEVELTTGQGADAVMTSVLSGQCEIGFAGPEASIYVYNEGKEDYCEVFAQMTKRDGSFLIARNDTDNFSWQDLKGKTIIPGRKGGVPYMTFEYVLKKNGLTPGVDVTLDDSIKFDLMAGAFTSGNADYVTLFEPTASLTEKQNKGYIVKSIGESAGEVPYTAYFAKKSYIKQNEDVIRGITKAIYKGQKWVKEHSAKEIASVIQSFFPDTDIDTLATAIQSYKDIDAWNDTPVLKEESFNKLQEIMTEAGELNEKAPYEKIVNNKYANEVIK